MAHPFRQTIERPIEGETHVILSEHPYREYHPSGLKIQVGTDILEKMLRASSMRIDHSDGASPAFFTLSNIEISTV